MKKLLFIIACAAQFVTAQTTPETGEYISVDRSASGINLLLNNDKTFQMFVFNGTYEFVNDSIIFNESLESKQKNAFNVKYSKNKATTKKLKFTVKPNFMMGFNSEFLGIQNKENGDIIYKSIYDYVKENNEDNELRSDYLDNEEDLSVSFELEKPYAVYLVADNKTGTKIEKYLIQSDVTEIIIENNFSLFDNLKLAGNINNDQSVNVFIDRKPMKFISKKKQAEIVFEKPTSKTIEKNWTYPGKNENNDFIVDSTAVAVDTAMAYTDYDHEDRFEFKAKIEKNFKEALLNIKKDTLTKYLFAYYNLNDKKAEKNFNDMIDEYNMSIGNSMYSGYDASYDNFNFYLATKNDESFFKKKNVKDKSFIILNKEGNILATSEKKLNDITYSLVYDSSYIKEKLNKIENTITLSNAVSNKKTSIPELTKSLNTNYKDFFTSNYYYNNHYIEVVESDNNENEVMAIEASAVVDSAAVAYENHDFTYYKSEISEKILTEKLNTIFEYYNSKDMVNNELVNILLGEISENHTSFDLFKNDNNTNNKQEIKYINYILKYNGDQKNKAKIAIVLNGLLSQKEANNPDIKAYNAIATSLISYSGNNFGIIQNEINNFNAKEKGSEDANKLVDLYYNILVNDKPVFENLDTQFNNLSTEVDYTMDWAGYKNRVNSMLNEQAWDIFELGKTKDFERAIKWSELSNIVEKDNPYSLDTLGQLYFAVGRKSEAIVIQTKAVALAKTMGISHEEFEEALNNMKK